VRGAKAMEVLYRACAGLDVHKKTVVACVLAVGLDGAVRKEVRTFGTMTRELEALAAWLAGQQVEQVAMESTGVYWWPVWNILEEQGLALLLVHPQHMRQVPGHKTDVGDSEWLADLCRHGLLAASFIPPGAIRELRELTRMRKTLVQERTAMVNRLQKTLESAGIKLASVASDVLGVSGRHMVEALVAGEADPEALADLARRKLRGKLAVLREALTGRVKPHHRLLLEICLAQIDCLEAQIGKLDTEVARRVAPFQHQIDLLVSISGIRWLTAVGLLAELGPDLTRFASAGHLASWAGVCPGNHESAGKRRGGTTTRGNVWLRGLLGEAAWAAVRVKGSACRARFYRIARRRGTPKALVAVMHHLLAVIYHVLTEDTPYREDGPDYYKPADAERQARAALRTLQKLGYIVQATKPDVVPPQQALPPEEAA